MENYPPIGWHLPFSILNINVALKKEGFNIPPKEILNHLNEMYNLDALVLYDNVIINFHRRVMQKNCVKNQNGNFNLMMKKN